MRSKFTNEHRVLAIDPTTKGFGFAVLEGEKKLVEWGTREANGNKNGSCLSEIGNLIRLYQPGVIVVEDCESKHSRRSRRVKDLVRQITRAATGWRVKLCRVSRLAVKRLFSPLGAVNKYEIAKMITQQFVELALRLPPQRKSWMAEDERFAIFDAVAFALAYFARRRTRKREKNQQPI
jgi:hypothetical protein